MQTSKKPGKRKQASGIALWRQVADSLRLDMRTLADETGRLPPEATLADHFGVNRLTLRAAVKALVDEKLLTRQQGRGTFLVKSRRFHYPLSARTRFSAGLEKQADERQVIVIASAQEKPHETCATALALSQSDDVIRLETLAVADDTPIIRSTSYFPAKRFAKIGAMIEEMKSITAAFKAHGVEDYLRKYTQIEAHLANETDCTDLQISPGGIVLHTLALNVDKASQPIQYAISRMAAERITLSITNDI